MGIFGNLKKIAWNSLEFERNSIDNRLEFMRFSTDLTPEMQADEHGNKLWEKDPDLCCNLRKVKPLIRALQNYDVDA